MQNPGRFTDASLSTSLRDILTVALQELIEAELTATIGACLLYTSPSPRDGLLSRMPSSA